MNARPTVTVALPVLDEEAHIESCLKAIAAQTYTNVVEVLVIDGGSSDRTREIALRMGATVLDNPNRIQAAALNVGLREAKGEVFVRVDGHCELADDYVEKCVDALIRSGAAMVGGAMSPLRGTTTMQRTVGAAMASPLAVGPARFHTGGEAGWVDTVYLGAYRTDQARAIGGYAEDVGVNEDAEFAIRMAPHGGVWFEPTIGSVYAPRESLRAVAKQFRRYGWSRAQTVVRHPSSMKPRQLAPLALVLLLAVPKTRRVTSAVYATGLGVAATRAGMTSTGDKARFAAVAATMHVSWAFGFMSGVRTAWRARR
jgi:glycosyltransferase involved in cell wall biosynthesis